MQIPVSDVGVSIDELIGNLEIDAVPEFENDDDFFEDAVDFIDDSTEEPNPCKTSFNEYKSGMEKIADEIWKVVTVPASNDAHQIDIKRQRITYRYNLYQEGIDAPFDSRSYQELDIYDRKTPCHLIGMVESIKSMRKGERAQFIIGYKKMFKALGCPPRVPEKADILADIEIVEVHEIGDIDEIRKLSYGDLNTYSSLKVAITDARHRAKDLFGRKLYKKAIGIYKRILDKALFMSTANADEKKEKDEIVMKSYLNVGICYNKLEDYKEALANLDILERLASRVVQDPKFLLHKGKALMMKGEYSDAKEVVKAGLMLVPEDVHMRKLSRDLEKRTENNAEIEKQFAKKFILG